MGNITVKSGNRLKTAQGTKQGAQKGVPETSSDLNIKVESTPFLIIFILGTIFYWFLILSIEKYLTTLNHSKELTSGQYLMVSLTAIFILWLYGRYKGLSFLDIEQRAF